MVTSNKELMTQARKSLSGRWGLAVGTFFVYNLRTCAWHSTSKSVKSASSACQKTKNFACLRSFSNPKRSQRNYIYSICTGIADAGSCDDIQ